MEEHFINAVIQHSQKLNAENERAIKTLEFLANPLDALYNATATRTAEMETTQTDIHNAIKDHLVYSCRKSFVPLNQWKHRLDAQQAFLELWWRDEPQTQKRLFGYFETVQEQNEQFHKAVNSIFRKMRLAQERRLTPEQEAQLDDAEHFIKFQIEQNLTSDTLRLDLPLESRDIEEAKNRDLKAIIPELHMERPVLERLVADFLLKDFFYCELLSPATLEGDDWETIAKERLQEETEKKKAIEQIRQKEQEADEAYETAIAINARCICDLRTQNEWRFEAWRLFVISFFIIEEGFEGFPVPLFYFCNPDDIIKQEFEAYCSNDPHKSPTLRMWKYHSSIDASDLNAWIDDTLKRLQRAASIDSSLLFAEIARPSFDGRWLPVFGSPPRAFLYAALFERLLLDPPEWIKALPEQGEQIVARENVDKMPTPPSQKNTADFRFFGMSSVMDDICKAEQVLGLPSHDKIYMSSFELEADIEVRLNALLVATNASIELHIGSIARRLGYIHGHISKHKKGDGGGEALQTQAVTPIQTPDNSQAPVKKTINHESTEAVFKPEPGHRRTMAELKKKAPEGLIVSELQKATVKDIFEEQTPRGSQDRWCADLNREGYIRSDGSRPQKWFFVKDL